MGIRKTETCRERIRFAEDRGERECTFRCQKRVDHTGKHEAEGDLRFRGQRLLYKVEWEIQEG